MTRRELMSRMGCDELKEWLAVERMYPFEDGYWQAARVALTIAECHGVKGAKLETYLPKRGKPQTESTPGKIRVGSGVLDRIQKAKERHGRV